MRMTPLRRMLVIGCATVLVLLGTGYCAESNSLEHSDALLVYPSASDVRWSRRGGKDVLEYRLNVAYPAQQVIDWVSDGLRQNGWTPMRRDFLNRDSASSAATGWQSFEKSVQGPKVCVHLWTAGWEDASRNVVSYWFFYEDDGCKGAHLSTLRVMAWYLPRQVAHDLERQLDQVKKKYGLR